MRAVYALRLRGEAECRYIGQSKWGGKFRLAFLTSIARNRTVHDAFSRWLVDNATGIEAITLAECPDERAARDEERRAIKLCLAMGHRLFNRQHVPTSQRIAMAEAA